MNQTTLSLEGQPTQPKVESNCMKCAAPLMRVE